MAGGSVAGSRRNEDAQALEGRTVGRYVLRYLVASGGMASVYLAQLAGHAGFEKWVALKRIHAHLADDARFVAMFLDEARVSSRIQHANVCSVIDFGEDEGTPYLVMEYLHGETLAQLARRGRESDGVPQWLAARAVADAARGLHAAHELLDAKGEHLQVVHRDVSPQNIVVLYDGVSKVLDFGVAKARGRLETTSTGEVKGKSAYFAPEQIEGKELDRRVDVWALGVVLWELLVGRRLFRGQSEAETLHRVLKAEIAAPSSIAEVPRELDAIVLRALTRDVDARYATAADLAAALESWLYTLGSPAGPPQVAEWMESHFKDKKATREAMLRSEAVPGHVPSVEMDSRRTMPSDASRAMVKKRRRAGAPMWALGLGALGLMGLTAGVMWWVMQGSGAQHDAAPGVTAPPPTRHDVAPTQHDVAPAQHEAPPPVAPTPSAPTPPTPAPPPAAPDTPAPATDTHDTTPSHTPRAPGRLNLIAVPPGEVYEGSRHLGATPLLELSLSAGRHHLTVRTPGAAARSVDVSIRPNALTRASVH